MGLGKIPFDLPLLTSTLTYQFFMQTISFHHTTTSHFQAYHILLRELKSPRYLNVDMYSNLRPICDSLAAGFEFDTKWIDEVEQKKSEIKERLENELLSAKSKLIKESIRSSYCDLGDFHDSCGYLVEARNCYLRTKEYCTNAGHMVRARLMTVSFQYLCVPLS